MKYVLISGLITTITACATTSASQPKTVSNPLEDAIQRDLARAGDQTKHVLRHNPVTCRCPAFELEVGARWVRVALSEIDEPESLAQSLQKQAEQDTKESRLQNYTVYGSLLDTIQRCGQGAPYLTLSLEAPPTPDNDSPAID